MSNSDKKHSRRQSNYSLIGGVLTFATLSIGEFLIITIVTSSLDWLYWFFCFVWLSILLLNWNFMIKIFQENTLSKKYRGLYGTLVFFVILANYLILLYPISPYIEPSEIFTNFLPAFFGGMTALTTSTIFVTKDISIKKQTGKSFWQLGDGSVKHLEKIFLVKILGIFPLVFLVAMPMTAFIYVFMSKQLGISTETSFLVALVPPLCILGILLVSIAKTSREIKNKMDDLTETNQL
ncbi:MAG: hypothetical protein ACTSW1_01835 [Candidatus Hodarchaeales archaeon]